MKTFTFFLLQACLLLFAFGVSAQTAKPVAAQSNMKQTEKAAKLPEVREELLRRLKASRELRMELVKNTNSAGVSHLVKTLCKLSPSENRFLKTGTNCPRA
jgi:hypothetical protein